MSLNLPPQEPLIANKFVCEGVSFIICNPPEPSVDEAGEPLFYPDGTPVLRYAYSEIRMLDHMDGKPVRRITLGNAALSEAQVKTLVTLFGELAYAYAAESGLTPGW